MRYSTRTRYGLRFLINLAARPEGTCVQLGEIAREEGVSVKYLEQIVRVLRPAGLLRSVRGARGGVPDTVFLAGVRRARGFLRGVTLDCFVEGRSPCKGGGDGPTGPAKGEG